LTLVYELSGGCRRLLWIGHKRTQATINQFFEWMGKARCKDLKFVCSDMWKAYLKAIARYAPQALNVLDRFHIVRHLNDAVDKTRREEAAAYRKKGDKVTFKHARWCLLKRPENRTGPQTSKLQELLKLNLKTVRAYLMKEDFESFWHYIHPTWAGKFLDDWCRRAMRSRLEPIKKVAGMLRGHRELVLNFFRAQRLTSATVEGFNNKLKLVTRKSYGFRTEETLEIALYHAMGELPMPPCPHRFA